MQRTAFADTLTGKIALGSMLPCLAHQGGLDVSVFGAELLDVRRVRNYRALVDALY